MFARFVSPNDYLPGVLSYYGERSPRGADSSPITVYNKIVNRTTFDESNALQELRRKSINDFLREQINDLTSRTDLSADDRQRLDVHFSSIRDLEIQMAECTPLNGARQSDFQQIEGDHERLENRQEVTEMLVDIAAFAIACGYTRSATIQVGSGNDSGRYTVNGELLPSYHQISHRIFSDESDGPPIPGAHDKHHEVDKVHARLFRRLLDRFSAYSTDQGILLDQGVSVWLNDLATGPGHGGDNLPFVLAGSAGGFLRALRRTNRARRRESRKRGLVCLHHPIVASPESALPRTARLL